VLYEITESFIQKLQCDFFPKASFREVGPLLRIKRLIYEFVSKTLKGG